LPDPAPARYRSLRMASASRTPVLVGAAALVQRGVEPERALEPIALMERAAEAAAEDAGARALLARADSIRVPRGLWSYPDPGRLLAERFGAAGARTEVFEVGVLQTTLLGTAARDVAEGRADVVLLAGGEARERERLLRRAGREVTLRAQAAVEPDRVWRPAGPILGEAELRAGLVAPVAQYALLENALRAAEGTPLDAQRDALAALQARLSAVAAACPFAWRREALSAEAIRTPGPGNRMLAFPYSALHVSQWHVDQAAALLLTSLETARRLGIARERLVFPWAVAEANAMLPLTERRPLHRSPGFAHAARRVLTHAGLEPGEVAHRELYSCFPVAVRVQLREMGLPEDAGVSVTGGMTFAGGPFNHFVLQAWARMVEVLRAHPGAAGLVTAVSGMLTKQGVSLLASRPPARPFTFEEVGPEAAREVERVAVVEGAEGGARLVTATVVFERDRPGRCFLLGDLDDGRRALVATDDPALATRLMREETAGLRLRLRPGGGVEVGDSAAAASGPGREV
jgi:acetyl-CoA C-acetyltransferase